MENDPVSEGRGDMAAGFLQSVHTYRCESGAFIPYARTVTGNYNGRQRRPAAGAVFAAPFVFYEVSGKNRNAAFRYR